MQSPQSPGICDSARETDVNQTVEQQTENSASKEKKLTKEGQNCQDWGQGSEGSVTD